MYKTLTDMVKVTVTVTVMDTVTVTVTVYRKHHLQIGSLTPKKFKWIVC